MNTEPIPRETALVRSPQQSEATQLNQWIFDTIRRFVRGRVLEIGSGSGHFSDLFVQNELPLRVSDQEKRYCRSLYERFKGESLVKGVYQIDPHHPQFEKEYGDMLEKFDTICVLNTLEHNPADKQAVENYDRLLRRGGHLILLLPAYTALYHENDEGFDHWWTYNRKNVTRLMTSNFQIRKTQFFKVMGHVGWYLSGLFLRDRNPVAQNSSLFQQHVPLFAGVDEITFHRTGLSIIAIGQKK